METIYDIHGYPILAGDIIRCKCGTYPELFIHYRIIELDSGVFVRGVWRPKGVQVDDVGMDFDLSQRFISGGHFEIVEGWEKGKPYTERPRREAEAAEDPEPVLIDVMWKK